MDVIMTNAELEAQSMGIQTITEESAQPDNNPTKFDYNLEELDWNGTEVTQETPQYGDVSTRAKPRAFSREIIQLVPKGSGTHPLFKKNEALRFYNDKNEEELRRRVDSELNRMLCPKGGLKKVPYTLFLHFSKESSKIGGIFWSDKLFESVVYIIGIVFEEAKKIGGIEVEVVNDDFHASLVFYVRP